MSLSAAGSITDGNSGSNYTVTYVADTTGVITARAITVTAAPNTKTYDGTTTAAALPTITSGSLATGDTGIASESYGTKNAGTGLTLTPTDSIADGNGGSNYAVTYVANTTGVIMARAITVTAAPNTKTYDGTTVAAALPAISSGSLATGDTVTLSESYATKNVGTGLTLAATDSIADGNGGNNYTVTLVSNTAGRITARAITVTAATNSKVYDGTTTAAALPAISSGSLATGDTVTLSESYAGKNVGTGLTLTPTDSIADGNGGSNYTVSLVTNTTGQISALAITVTAASNSKVYDGTTTAAASPTITLGSLAPGDTARFSESYAAKNVGTSLTLTPAGSIADGNGGSNYTVSLVTDGTGAVTARPLTVTATGMDKVYDGTTNATVILSDDRVVGDNLTDSYASASFASASVGTDIAVSVTGISISGSDAGNYALQNTTASTTANIVYQSVAVIDDGDPGWTTSGTWTRFSGQGYENDVDQATPVASSSGQAATATWTFTALNPNQEYMVETTWSRNANRATNAPFTISGGPSTLTLPITVNQQQAPVGMSTSNPTGGTTSWQELGVYEPTTGELVVTLSNAGANGNVIADAVYLVPVPTSGPAIMVQAGTGSASDPVVLPTLSGSVQTIVSFGATSAGGVAQKTFTVFNGGGGALSLTGLAVTGSYTVVSGGFTSTTPVTVPSGGTATFVLQENTSTVGTVPGAVTITSNDGSVNQFYFPLTGTVADVAPTAAISNTGPVNVGAPVTVSLSNPVGYGSPFHYSFAFSEAALSKSYAGTSPFSSATYSLNTAGTYTVWGRILDKYGMYTDSSTQVTVTSTALVIDDSNSSSDAPGAWSVTSGTWTNWTGQGYDGNVHQATPVTSTNSVVATAQWEFTGLTPNQYYKVETTWTQNANRATNAPYTISGGPSTLTLPVIVNQRLAPVGVVGDNGMWQELGVYQVSSSGTLFVTLSNSGTNGNVIADGVRLQPVPVSGPAIMVQASATDASPTPSDPVVLPTLAGVQTTVNFGSTSAGGLAQKTFTVFNGGGAALSLTSLTVVGNYTVVSGGFTFGSPVTVPSGGTATFVLQENTSTVGTVPGEVMISSNDGSEPLFMFPLTGTVGDVAPTATLLNNGPVVVGSPVTVSFVNPTDPVLADTKAGFHYSFAFSEAALSRSYTTLSPIASAKYTLTTAGTYTVWGRIIDVNGLYTDYSTVVVVNAIPTVTIKAGSAGWTTTGTWVAWPAQGYAGDDYEAVADSSTTATATATYTFNNLTVGATYQVYVTWPINRDRATNVPYTLTVGGTLVASTKFNQQVSPPTSIAGTGPTGGAYNWYQLGAAAGYQITASGTTVVVTVSNAGTNGYVEADAVMLVQTQPELAAGGLGHNPNAAPLTVSEAMPLVHEAELRWAAAGANISALGNIQVSIGNLPGLELGESSSVVDTIYLDTNAKGWGWYIDPAPGQNSAFPVQVTKTEDLATSGPAAGEMDLLTVIMHEMGHFLGQNDLNPQLSPYDLMSADLAAGVRRLPDSAVVAAVAQTRSAQAQASGQGSAAAQAKDAVFGALAQSQGETTTDKAAAGESDAWWLLYGQE